MPRPKSERHSTDLAAEIARLEQERKRLFHPRISAEARSFANVLPVPMARNSEQFFNR
jgi:hypothetical protein